MGEDDRRDYFSEIDAVSLEHLSVLDLKLSSVAQNEKSTPCMVLIQVIC